MAERSSAAGLVAQHQTGDWIWVCYDIAMKPLTARLCRVVSIFVFALLSSSRGNATDCPPEYFQALTRLNISGAEFNRDAGMTKVTLPASSSPISYSPPLRSAAGVGVPDVALHFPEVAYRKPDFLNIIPVTVTPEAPKGLKKIWTKSDPPYLTYRAEIDLEKMKQFLSAEPEFADKNLTLELWGRQADGGMSKLVRVTAESPAGREKFVVKVFSPDRPFFFGDFFMSEKLRREGIDAVHWYQKYAPAWKHKKVFDWESTVAALVQRQAALYQFLLDAPPAASKALGIPITVRPQKTSMAPHFLNAGVFVQREITGDFPDDEGDRHKSAWRAIRYLDGFDAGLTQAMSARLGPRSVSRGDMFNSVPAGLDIRDENFRVQGDTAVFLDW